jgi:hypothetical protein
MLSADALSADDKVVSVSVLSGTSEDCAIGCDDKVTKFEFIIVSTHFSPPVMDCLVKYEWNNNAANIVVMRAITRGVSGSTRPMVSLTILSEPQRGESKDPRRFWAPAMPPYTT